MKRKALDSDRNRGKLETPEAQLRRLDFLPAESKRLQRKGTDYFFLYLDSRTTGPYGS
ncbi:hypothetical protein ABER02_16010 [Rossellomorea marisflavi]|uniref:hypothetical protein n=1 Tax=Rossellomorea marisflavi TaxID=189381 RepID=UPI000AEE4E46|nr:hypothetical protein [Rossellomorea marisflavi]